jgi:hypothetical protein
VWIGGKRVFKIVFPIHPRCHSPKQPESDTLFQFMKLLIAALLLLADSKPKPPKPPRHATINGPLFSKSLIVGSIEMLYITNKLDGQVYICWVEDLDVNFRDYKVGDNFIAEGSLKPAGSQVIKPCTVLGWSPKN